MADAQDQTTATAKDPQDWTTGDEAATGPQLSYLHTLAQQAGEEVDTEGLTKAKASQEIERLQHVTGRGGEATESAEPTASSEADEA